MRKINVSINNFKIENLKETDIYQAFLVYKENGVIRCGSYADKKWYLTDEYENCNFDFTFSEEDYEDYKENLGISLNDMITYLKAFIVCKLGEYNLNSIRQFVTDLRKMFKMSFSDLANELEDAAIPSLSKMIEFFESLQSENKKEEFIYLRESLRKNLVTDYKDNKRLLASFDSYFKFNDIITNYWHECTDEEEKLFFFPVWFWWRLSSVYPMRPREVVLTPRSCIKKVNGVYRLTVRKDKKKGNGKKKLYKIDGDYKIFTFAITDDFANDIIWYQDKTRIYPDNELKTLFCTDTHYRKWERNRPYTSRYLTYINLNTCLRYFFEIIVRDYYGYELIDDIEEKHLNSNQIHRFNLGDTRHLSLIGIIFSGAPASVAQALAGHDNVDMAAHYYTNIASFIETDTYRKYKRLTAQEKLSLSTYRGPSENEYTLVEGGKCFSKHYPNNDLTDCTTAYGPCGEIGYCPNCRYFRTSGRRFSTSKKEYERMIEKLGKTLATAVDSVRKSKGYEEDITKGILELNTLASEYTQYLKETKGEETWQDHS